jgi:hypothetical protein
LSRLKQEKSPKKEKNFQKMQKIFQNPLEKGKKMCYSNGKQVPKKKLQKDFLGGKHL